MRGGLAITVFLAVFSILQVQVRAQEGKTQLAPKELLQLIETNGSYAFAEAAANIEAAKARLDGARANLFPKLTVSAGGQFYESTQQYREDDAEFNTSVEVVQPIYDFGQTYGKIKAARSQVAANEERLREARNTVLLEGLAMYFDLHASELRMESLNQNFASAYVRWERAVERHGLGKVDPVAVAEKLAIMEKGRHDFRRERSRNRTLRLRLEDITGNAFEGNMIAPPLPSIDRPAELDLDKLTAVAAVNNPAILALTKQAEALAFQREGTGSRPRLDAFGNVNHYNRDLRGRNEWAVGAKLSWPVFDGGIKGAERSRLAAEESGVNARLEVLKRKTSRDIRARVMSREDSWQQLNAARAKLDFANRRLLQRQRFYEQERVSDLGRAMIDFTATEAEMIQAAGAYYVDTARLVVLLGETPARGLETDFLKQFAAATGGPDNQFTPKEGTGFGQDDQFKTE